jgi:cytochrome b561
VILWATFSGFFLATLDEASPLRALLSFFNVSLTTAFTPLFVLRVVNSLRSKRPAPLSMSRSRQLAAKTVHALLYAVTAVVLVSGLLMMQHDIPEFDLLTVPQLLRSTQGNAIAYAIHRYSCMVLLTLIVGHVAAVVSHQRAGRDVLSRMRGKRPPELCEAVK